MEGAPNLVINNVKEVDAFNNAVKGLRESIRVDKITNSSNEEDIRKNIDEIDKCFGNLLAAYRTLREIKPVVKKQKVNNILSTLLTLISSFEHNTHLPTLDYVDVRGKTSEDISTQLNELERIIYMKNSTRGGRRTRRRSTRRRRSQRRR